MLAPGGKLLIVDFAPHDLEFLREAEAHERLGFPQNQVEQWMIDAGLQPKGVRDLAPKKGQGTDKLTVSLWLAERPVTARPAASAEPAQSLEEAQ